MTTQTEYRQHAEDCVRLAQTASTRQQHSALLLIASAWLQLADETGCNQASVVDDGFLRVA